jgi:hypothetical protein
MERQAAARRQAGQGWALLAIILLAFVLRIYTLGQGPLWFDEALSGVIAGKGWEGILAHTASTPFEHPPLYYMALHVWMSLAGSSAFSLRFFSLFWGVLLIPLLFRFIKPWGGQRLALLTALVTAVSVTHIDQSQNARMYTLVVFLGVLSLFLFFRGLAGRRRSWWAGYLIVTGIGVALHYYFGLLLLVPVAILLISGPRYRRALIWLVAGLLGAGLLAAGWLWLSPGPRQAIQQVLSGGDANAASLALRIRYTAGGLLLEEPIAGTIGLGILALLGVFFWPLPAVPDGHPLRLVGSRRFLLIWLVVPWLAALAIPYWLQGRHLAYLWPALFTLAAAGLLALRAKGTWLFVAGLALVAVTFGYSLYDQEQTIASRPEFGQTMGYIEDQAAPNDLVISNQPAMWPFVDFYAPQGLKVTYVPEKPRVLTPERVAERLEVLARGRSRIWLGPISAWTADPESLVEQWLVTHTFQADKEWFPGSVSAALYFTGGEDLAPVEIGRPVWGERILLQNASAGPLQVSPGDAVRLLLSWRSGLSQDKRYAVDLSLVDDKGQVWADRQSEPCSGWCPTDTWLTARLQQDRHALLVPPGTPPGTYQIQVAWVPVGGGPALAAEQDGQSQEHISLTQVEVLPPEADPEVRPAVPNPLQAIFGGEITLKGYELSRAEAQPDDVLHLETRWQAETRPAGDYSLLVELVDSHQRPIAGWEFSPSASFYPTSSWQAGEYLRGQHDLQLPNTLATGHYRLRLALVAASGEQLAVDGQQPQTALGGLLTWQKRLAGQNVTLAAVQIHDRPREFDLPAVEHELQAVVGQQAHLVGYDLDTSQAHPGGQVAVVLYWQADGPMVRPFKVFAHLVDGEGTIQAQHDSEPGGGCCPANTWVKGEIIVDKHLIPLKEELAVGSYQLVVGMYDNEMDARLPAYGGDGIQLDQDRIPIDTVTVEPAKRIGQAATPPAAPKFELEHRIFLPWISRAEP